MAERKTELGGLNTTAAGAGGAINPSIRNALPYFMPLVVFPLIISAVLYGGWWITGPIVFIMLVESLDGAFGSEERNMDFDMTPESQLFWYELTVWAWAVLWPVTFVFALWQILIVGHLSIWEVVLMIVILVNVGQAVFIVGHELIHRRSVWERRIGEFLLASASYPHYATEHIYIHHAQACTPADPGTAPKGVSFWQHIPRDLTESLIEAWCFSRDRLTRRRLPIWHYTNPFWRYVLETAAWYALVYWMGGPWALLIFISLCFSVILSMKVINYAQHYGLQRIRLPSGRFERVQPRHSWSASSKFTNWLFYNMQRHPDHHIEANRHYPLLQHYAEDEAPQMPGSYLKMAGLALFPKRWFQAMDPLVDSWRARFYPQIDDWSAYDSAAFAARPDAFEAIAEILSTAPRVGEWINYTPELLDNLSDREFTDLSLPKGLGPDLEFEIVARRGLARLYWTHEFSISEMKERIAEFPVQGAGEAGEVARHWSNDKVFQIGVHAMRGSLMPTEAGVALSNVAEASISAFLSAIEGEFASRHQRRGEGGIAAVAIGDLASRETVPGDPLDVIFVYGGSDKYYGSLCRRFREELRTLLHDNLLFAWPPRDRKVGRAFSLTDFTEHYKTTGSTSELLGMTQARYIFESGSHGMGECFDMARREILTHGAAHDELIGELREANEDRPDSGLLSINDMRGGLRDVERTARFLQLTHADDAADILAPDAVSIFQTASARGLIPGDIAEHLVEAARMWRNLQGILRLVAEDSFAEETASPTIKDAVARSCCMDDFDELIAAVRQTASHAAAGIDTLTA